MIVAEPSQLRFQPFSAAWSWRDVLRGRLAGRERRTTMILTHVRFALAKPMTLEQFAAFMTEDMGKWPAILAAAGLKADQ